MAFRIRTEPELQALAEAGRRVRSVLNRAAASLEAGPSTRQINDRVEDWLESEDLVSSLSSIRHPEHAVAYPGVLSISINDQAAHAPPSDRVLEPADLVTLDLAANLDGWHADAAISVVIPGAPLITQTNRSLALAAGQVTQAAIEALRPGGRWAQAAASARQTAARLGVSILPGLGGHGIGRALHEQPQARFDAAAINEHDFTLGPGTVITVEPIVTRNPTRGVAGPDGWTIRTESGEPAACSEQTVAVWGDQIRVLTGDHSDSRGCSRRPE